MRAELEYHGGGLRSIHVIQGQYGLATRPDEVLCTLLGSCVAACLSDPVAGVGGMNHFLLPGAGGAHGEAAGGLRDGGLRAGGLRDGGSRDGSAMKYGVHAMELLINALLRAGARRARLRARLYGGANMLDALPQIGTANARFARDFLRNEGIRCVASDLGGRQARRLRFFAQADRVELRLVTAPDPVALAAPRPPPAPRRSGEVTFF